MKKTIQILAIAFLVAAVYVCRRPKAESVFERTAVRSPVPAAEMIIAGLGGFRGLISEFVWLKADILQTENRFAELAQVTAWLTYLEPHTPEVWAFASWNLAYNVSVMMPTFEDRWRWVEAGRRLLQQDALSLNPSDSQIMREIGWLFLSKIGGTLDDAAPYYRERWAELVGKAEKTGDWSATGLEPMRMAAIDAAYGKQDWSDPLASAVYWADAAIRTASTVRNRADARQVLCQALLIETVKNPAFAKRALEELRKAAAETPNSMFDEMISAFKKKYGVIEE